MIKMKYLQQAAKETYDLGDLCIEFGQVKTVSADFEKKICLNSLSRLLHNYKENNDYTIVDLEDIFYIDAQTLRKVFNAQYVGEKTRFKIYSQLAAKGELNLR
jgi:predicted RNA binding protein with dsRBD fold (UPF0201 family)